MNRGKLRKYAMIKRPVYETISGQPTITGYGDYSGIYITEIALSGSESEENSQKYSSELLNVKCSYVDGIKHDDIVEMDSLVYDIISVWPRFEINITEMKIKLSDNFING